MPVQRYRKKPVVIEAIRFETLNTTELLEFCPVASVVHPNPELTSEPERYAEIVTRRDDEGQPRRLDHQGRGR